MILAREYCRFDSLKGVLLGLILPMSVFQDLALQHSPLGVAVGSPVFVLVFLLAILKFIEAKLSLTWAFKMPIWVYVYVISFVILNLLYGAFWGFSAYDENLVVKALKVFIIYWALVYCAWLFIHKSISPRVFRFWVFFAFALACLGLVVDLLHHDEWVRNWWFHYGINDSQFVLRSFDDRPRGFSYESSTLGVTLSVFGLLSASQLSSRWFALTIFLFTLSLVLISGSKAALPVLLFSAIISLLLRADPRVYLGIFASFIFVSVLFLSGMGFLIPGNSEQLFGPLISDIQHSTSFATRFSLMIAAILTTLMHPFGVGFIGYINGIVMSVPLATEILQSITPLPLNFAEINGYLTQDSLFAISAKSFFFDGLIIFGIPFAVLWIMGHLMLLLKLKKLGNIYLLVLFFVLFVSLTFYVPGVNMYLMFVGYGYMIQSVLFNQNLVLKRGNCEGM